MNPAKADPGTLNSVTDRFEEGENKAEVVVSLLAINNADTPETKVDLLPWWRKYLGLMLVLVAAVSFAINSIVSKVIVEKYNVFLVAFVRTLGVFFPTMGFMVHASHIKKQQIFDPLLPLSKNRLVLGAVLGRGIFGATVNISFTSAIKFISVGDTTVIKSSAPLWVAFFASCCLHESLGMIPILCGIQIVLGVFCIAKPPFMTGKGDYDSNTLFGTFLAIVLAVASALGVICVRYARKLHFSIPACSMGTIGSLSSGIICLALGGFMWPKNWEDGLCFVTVAACTAISQIMTVLALKYDNAGYTSLVRTSEVFFGWLLELVFLHHIPDQLSTIGAMIVMLAVIIAIVSKNSSS